MAKADRGERVPELATLLRAISERLERGHETEASAKRDAEILWRIAESADGIGRFELRLHCTKRGRQRGGVKLFEQRLEMAEEVFAHIAKHGGSIEDAAGALTQDMENSAGVISNRKFDQSDETVRKAAYEFEHILKMPADKQDFLLSMKRQEALGRVKVSRIKRAPKSGK